MKRIAFLVAHLHRYDAIAADIRGLMGFFQKHNYTCRIFASSADPGLGFYHPDTLDAFIKDKDDIVVLNYAGHWSKGEHKFTKSMGKKILRYHNVTPPEYFEPYDPATANMCLLGREGLADLLKACAIDLFLPDSDYNALDLLAAGAKVDSIKRLPVFHQIDDLLLYKDDSDPLIESLFAQNTQVHLMVGRIVPNKGYLNLIQGFAAYTNQYNANSVLVMAGSFYPSFYKYYRELESLIRFYQLENQVCFLSGLEARQLATLYKRCDLFSICSEHEGFCVPVVEAMAFRKPILALHKSAVGETLASAGLTWPDFDERIWACSIHQIMTDTPLARHLAESGHERYLNEYSHQSVYQSLQKIWDLFCMGSR